MRILMLCDYFPPHIGGGVERVADELCRGLVQRGHKVTVLTLKTRPAPATETNGALAICRVPALDLTRWLGVQFAASVRVLDATARLIRSFRPDLVHAHNLFFRTTEAVALLRMIFHVPLVTTLHLARLGRKTIRYLTIALVVIVLSGVLLFGEHRAERAFNHYRVVDGQVLAALDWLQGQGSPGDLVVANETPRGILGWWVEGYAKLPTYLAVDTRWLLFRDERSQAEIAHRFLSADAEPEELRSLAETYQVKFLFLHRETLENPLTNLFKAGFDISFVNESMIILTYDR